MIWTSCSIRKPGHDTLLYYRLHLIPLAIVKSIGKRASPEELVPSESKASIKAAPVIVISLASINDEFFKTASVAGTPSPLRAVVIFCTFTLCSEVGSLPGWVILTGDSGVGPSVPCETRNSPETSAKMNSPVKISSCFSKAMNDLVQKSKRYWIQSEDMTTQTLQFKHQLA